MHIFGMGRHALRDRVEQGRCSQFGLEQLVALHQQLVVCLNVLQIGTVDL